MYEHKCKEILDSYTIFVFGEPNHIAILENTYIDDVYIEGIKFCPWCGEKLEEST